jgi:hypothetical protein
MLLIIVCIQFWSSVMKTYNRKYFSIAALTMGMLSASQCGHAFQPAGISWSVNDLGVSSGSIKTGDTQGGEAQVYIGLKFSDAKQQSPLLVLVRNCGQDPEVVGKPVLNLESLLLGRAKSPVYNTAWVNPGPRWRICPRAEAVLLNDATSNQILPLEIDFLRAEDGGISPRLEFDVYEISAAEVRSQLTV